MDLDQVLWELWRTADAPEGYRFEAIKGAFAVSPTGGHRHFRPAKGSVIGPEITGERRG